MMNEKMGCRKRYDAPTTLKIVLLFWSRLQFRLPPGAQDDLSKEKKERKGGEKEKKRRRKKQNIKKEKK